MGKIAHSRQLHNVVPEFCNIETADESTTTPQRLLNSGSNATARVSSNGCRFLIARLLPPWLPGSLSLLVVEDIGAGAATGSVVLGRVVWPLARWPLRRV